MWAARARWEGGTRWSTGVGHQVGDELQTEDGVPIRDGFPDKWWGFGQGWFQTLDDGVSDRGWCSASRDGVTTLTSHQVEFFTPWFFLLWNNKFTKYTTVTLFIRRWSIGPKFVVKSKILENRGQKMKEYWTRFKMTKIICFILSLTNSITNYSLNAFSKQALHWFSLSVRVTTRIHMWRKKAF